MFRTSKHLLVAVGCALTQHAIGQCGVEYVNTFWAAGLGGSGDAAAVFDSGSGPELYVGGAFRYVGSVRAPGIARWDGASWRPLTSDLESDSMVRVRALAVYDDDGDGPNPASLFVGGEFDTGGGEYLSNIGRWDGRAWASLGNRGLTGSVNALLVFDFDGAGPQPPKLVAAGDGIVPTSGDEFAQSIAVWDGQEWSALGDSLDREVYSLAAWDADGAAPALAQLIAGGVFTQSGTARVNRIARWDGASWQPLDDVFGDTPWHPAVLTLASFDSDASGPRPPLLFAGGSFETLTDPPIENLAVWDGQSWSTAGGSAAYTVVHLAPTTENDEPVLYATGYFQQSIGGVNTGPLARWDGESWSRFSASQSPWGIRTLTRFADAGGANPPSLYAAGQFSMTSALPMSGIARWDGTAWRAVVPNRGIVGGVYALEPFDPDGSGPAPSQLLACGAIERAGEIAIEDLAAWNGAEWTAILPGTDGAVRAAVQFDDGTGPALYVVGRFEHAGTVPARNVARWNGVEWSALGGGIPQNALTIAVHDDGTGPALYVGGGFELVDDETGDSAIGVVRWDGSRWRGLGYGLGGALGTVAALASWDPDNEGPIAPLLVATGSFTYSGSTNVRNIAAWNGTQWQRLGSGLSNSGLALMTLRNGLSAELYVAGNFDTAGGVVANSVARWDGQTWSALGDGIGPEYTAFAFALCAFDSDGAGPAAPTIYAGGRFGLQRWDGDEWSDAGLSGGTPEVRALRVFDDGDGPALFIGGGFQYSDGLPANCIAKLARRGPVGDLNRDLTVDLADLAILLNHFGSAGDASAGDGDLDGDRDVDLSDLVTLLSAIGNTCP